MPASDIIRISDDTLFEQAISIHLSIEVDNNETKIALLDKDKNKYFFFEHIKLPLQQSLKESLVFSSNKQIASATACIVDLKSTLLPNELFNENEIKVITNYNFNSTDNNNYKFNNLLSNTIVNIYGINNEMQSSIQEKIPKVEFLHQNTILIESLEDGFHLHITNKLVHLILKENGNLIFCNSFEYKNDDDILYFLALVLQKHEKDFNTIIIGVSGNISYNSTIIEKLASYIPKENIKYNSIFKDFLYSANLYTLPKQKHFTLFNQYKCV